MLQPPEVVEFQNRGTPANDDVVVQEPLGREVKRRPEGETLRLIRTTCRAVEADCRALATSPKRGRIYERMRANLRVIEEGCRDMAYNREDARWLPVGLAFEHAHKVSQRWLQYHFPRAMFLKLAENCAALAARCQELETKATGRMGLILPRPLPGPHRETRPVQLILPPGYRR